MGGTNDTAAGLVHIEARGHDTFLNRFTTVDPLFNLADPVSHNAYVYANISPISGSDPTGLYRSSPCPDGCDA